MDTTTVNGGTYVPVGNMWPLMLLIMVWPLVVMLATHNLTYRGWSTKR